jgi:hypothetical protein
MPTAHDPFDLALRIAELDEEAREHLQFVLATLVSCYGDEDGQAVIMYAPVDSKVTEVIMINCTDMDAARLVDAARACMLALNVVDAPEKEKFN